MNNFYYIECITCKEKVAYNNRFSFVLNHYKHNCFLKITKE